MQQTIYACDDCGKTIGEKPHVTMSANIGLTGIALPPGYAGIEGMVSSSSWQVHRIPRGFMHFCNPACLANLFRKLQLEVTPLKPKPRSKVAQKKKSSHH